MPKLKPLSDQSIVITGASSGIGLATARAAAKAGAVVTLAARNEEALRAICDELVAQGHQAIFVQADVGNDEQVRAVAEAAKREFGRIDTWVNNAGVDIWGELLDVSDEDSRRLFDTNFWGVVHGSRAAVSALREHGGALITVASVASDRAFPLQGMYCASKHAVKAYSEALRMEVEASGAPISFTLIKPSSIATPLSQQAKNYLAHEPKLPSPLYEPEDVARAILYAATHPKRDIYVGSAGHVLTVLGALAPRLTDIIGEKLLFAAQEQDEPAKPRIDNLHAAGPRGGQQTDVTDGRQPRTSISTRLALNPGSTMVAIAGLVAVAALATSRLRR